MKGKILDYNIQESKGIISGDDGQRYSFENKDWKSSELPKVDQIIDFATNGTSANEIYVVKGKSSQITIEKLKDYYVFNMVLAGLIFCSLLYLIDLAISSYVTEAITNLSVLLLLISFFGFYLSYVHLNKLINYRYGEEKDHLIGIFICGFGFLVFGSIGLFIEGFKMLLVSSKNDYKFAIELMSNYSSIKTTLILLMVCLGILSLSVVHSRYSSVKSKVPKIKKLFIHFSFLLIILSTIYLNVKSLNFL